MAHRRPELISGSPDPVKRDRLQLALVATGVVGAVVFRWLGLGKQSLWRDEGYTVVISQFPLKGIWRGAATDVSPPLYYFLLHFWIHLFGISEASIRAMSAFFETLSIPVFYLLAKRVLRDKAAVAIALWLYALSAFQVQYAQEARFYGILVFFSLVSVYSLMEFLEQRSIVPFITLVLSLAGGLYTHNIMFFYLPGLVLLSLLYPSAQSLIRRTLDGVICGAVVLILYLPWLPMLLSQTKAVARGFWPARPTLLSLSSTTCTLLGLDVSLLSASFSQHLPLLRHERTMLAAGVLALVACIAGGLWRVPLMNQKKVLAFGAYVFVPILIVFFFSRAFSSIYIDRVFIASASISPILVVAPIAFQVGNRRRVFLALGIAALLANAFCLRGYFGHFQKEDWRDMTAYVTQLPPENRLIVFVPRYCKMLFDYYAPRFGNIRGRSPETGLPEEQNLKDPVSPRAGEYSNRDLLIPLRSAVESGNFKEIDLVGYPATIGAPLTTYLEENCSTRPEFDFNGVKIVRCTLRKN